MGSLRQWAFSICGPRRTAEANLFLFRERTRPWANNASAASGVNQTQAVLQTGAAALPRMRARVAAAAASTEIEQREDEHDDSADITSSAGYWCLLPA